MDEIEMLRQYAARSKAVPPPNVDVTARVMRTLAATREERVPLSLRPLFAVVAASWLAVLLTGVFVQQAWSELQDPLASLISPFVISLQ